ncbi:hypothetical protein BS17DRAFT_522653 [Gyrodon lividus]|nr:hypothetical protein BS17DRAFT_522653 [Gyrodon lividus]
MPQRLPTPKLPAPSPSHTAFSWLRRLRNLADLDPQRASTRVSPTCHVAQRNQFDLCPVADSTALMHDMPTVAGDDHVIPARRDEPSDRVASRAFLLLGAVWRTSIAWLGERDVILRRAS